MALAAGRERALRTDSTPLTSFAPLLCPTRARRFREAERRGSLPFVRKVE